MNGKTKKEVRDLKKDTFTGGNTAKKQPDQGTSNRETDNIIPAKDKSPDDMEIFD